MSFDTQLQTNGLDLLNIIVNRRLMAIPDKAQFESVIRIIAFAQKDYRFFLMAEETTVDDLWDKVRESTSVSDFLLGVAIEYHFHMGSEQMRLATAALAAAFSVHHGGDSSMDDDLTERMASREFLAEVLKNNPWLVVMMSFQLLEDIVTIVENTPPMGKYPDEPVKQGN